MELFKVQVKNLGRIKEAELSIRPLTVFFGPNNTNKTWVANAIYGLARRLQAPVPNWFERSDPSIDAVLLDPETTNLIDQEASRFVALAKKVAEHTNLVDRIRARGGRSLRTTPLRLSLDSKGLAPFLFVSETDLPDATVALSLDDQRTKEHDWPCRVAEEVTLKFSNGGPLPEPSRGQMYFSAHLDDTYIWNSELSGMDFDALDRKFVKPAITDLFLAKLGKVVAFPAERNALVALCCDREFQAEGLKLSGTHFLKLLKLLGGVPRFYPQLGLDRIAAVLEKRILDGRVVPDPTVAGGGRWVYQANSGARFEMQAASSLVRSLGGFDAYVKSFAAPGDLIVIDEPEMNAHPDAQLMLAEVLGILVKRRVSVILTTHSPYFVDHFNNLMEAAQLPAESQSTIAKRFKLDATEAFLPSDLVAVYEFGEDGQIRDRVDRDDRTIDWSTFGLASDQVTNLYSDILDEARTGQHDAV